MLGEFGEDEDEKEEIPDVKGVSFFTQMNCGHTSDKTLCIF